MEPLGWRRAVRMVVTILVIAVFHCDHWEFEGSAWDKNAEKVAERLCPALDLFLRWGRLLLESRFAAWPGPLAQFGCEIAHGSFLNNPQLIEFGFGKVGPKLVDNYGQCVRRLA